MGPVSHTARNGGTGDAEVTVRGEIEEKSPVKKICVLKQWGIRTINLCLMLVMNCQSARLKCIEKDIWRGKVSIDELFSPVSLETAIKGVELFSQGFGDIGFTFKIPTMSLDWYYRRPVSNF